MHVRAGARRVPRRPHPGTAARVELIQSQVLACLRLSAALGYDKAVKELRRREQKRQLTDLLGGKDRGKRERFIRNDKARAWTAKEERGEQYL